MFDTSQITRLPDDPVGVRLCDLADTGSVLAPPEELSTGQSDLVAQFNQAEQFDPNSLACTADAGPAYAMVFRYADGSAVTVTSMMAGCRTVGGRLGGQELVALFIERLTAQRAGRTPNPPVAGDRCEGAQMSWMPVNVEDLVTVSKCTGTTRDTTAGTVTADQWAILQRDLLANAKHGAYPAAATEPERYIAADSWGQPMAWERVDDVVVLNRPLRGGGHISDLIWNPSPEALAILDSL